MISSYVIMKNNSSIYCINVYIIWGINWTVPLIKACVTEHTRVFWSVSSGCIGCGYNIYKCGLDALIRHCILNPQ